MGVRNRYGLAGVCGIAALVFGALGCSGSDESAAAEGSRPGVAAADAETPAVGESPAPGNQVEVPAVADDGDSPTEPTGGDGGDAEDGGSTIARVETPEIVVRDAPDEGAAVVATLTDRTPFGSPRTLLVVEERDGWVQALLPVRPNGATGWVRTDEVSLTTTDLALEIDRDTNTLTLRRGGEVALQESVAVGTGGTPTPEGQFYVTDLIEPADPGGAYGPYAFGLSAHSDVLDTFAGGDGQIGLHGTDDEAAIGQDVSHGCIRLSNDAITSLAGLLPLGTPVLIR